jgi:hypothetical protein
MSLSSDLLHDAIIKVLLHSGLIALTPLYSEGIQSVRNGSVPNQWKLVSWESTSLSAWIGSLNARYEQLNGWLMVGRPKAFWLSGFFNPQVGRRNDMHYVLQVFVPTASVHLVIPAHSG